MGNKSFAQSIHIEGSSLINLERAPKTSLSMFCPKQGGEIGAYIQKLDAKVYKENEREMERL